MSRPTSLHSGAIFTPGITWQHTSNWLIIHNHKLCNDRSYMYKVMSYTSHSWITAILQIATFQGLHQNKPFFNRKILRRWAWFSKFHKFNGETSFSSFRIWETWLSLIVPGTYELPFDSVHTEHHTSTHTTSIYRRDIAMCRLEKLPKNPKKSMLISTTKSIFAVPPLLIPNRHNTKPFSRPTFTRMSP